MMLSRGAFVQAPQAALRSNQPHTLFYHRIDTFVRSASEHMFSRLDIRPSCSEVILVSDATYLQLHWFPDAFSSISFDESQPWQEPIFPTLEEHAYRLSPGIVVEFDVSMIEFSNKNQGHE